MPSLLSGSKFRTGGSGEFLKLADAMPQLTQSPKQTTGFTLVTNEKLQTFYSSSLGNIQFDQGQIYSNINTQTLTIIGTGTTAVVVRADNPISSTSTFIVQGGASVFGDLYVAESFEANTTTFLTVQVTGKDSSSNTTTGALVVAGGAGIGENVNIGGSVYSQDGIAEYNNLVYTPKVTISLTAPLNPKIGDFWIIPQYGVECQYVNDGGNFIWIQFTGF